jgi:hypothetical protein
VESLNFKTIDGQDLYYLHVIPIAANVVVLNDYALDPCPVCGVGIVNLAYERQPL